MLVLFTMVRYVCFCKGECFDLLNVPFYGPCACCERHVVGYRVNYTIMKPCSFKWYGLCYYCVQNRNVIVREMDQLDPVIPGYLYAEFNAPTVHDIVSKLDNYGRYQGHEIPIKYDFFMLKRETNEDGRTIIEFYEKDIAEFKHGRLPIEMINKHIHNYADRNVWMPEFISKGSRSVLEHARKRGLNSVEDLTVDEVQETGSEPIDGFSNDVIQEYEGLQKRLKRSARRYDYICQKPTSSEANDRPQVPVNDFTASIVNELLDHKEPLADTDLNRIRQAFNFRLISS